MDHDPIDADARQDSHVFAIVGWGLALLIILLTGLVLPGCGSGRAPATKAEAASVQRVSDADAGDAAAKQFLGPATPPQVVDILDGAAAFTRASAGSVQLPAPSWTPDRIIADPAAYRKAGQSAERTAQGTQFWFWAKVAGGMALPILLALTKNIPGWGGLVGGTVEALWHVYTPTATKEEDEARTMLASHAGTVIQMATAVIPPGDLRAAFAHVPPEVRNAADTLGIPLPSPSVPTQVPLAAKT